jgi:ankyrin repeat protein
MAAAENGYADVVSLLLDHGADPQATDYTGRTPLDYAREGRSASAERLIKEASGG